MDGASERAGLADGVSVDETVMRPRADRRGMHGRSYTGTAVIPGTLADQALSPCRSERSWHHRRPARAAFSCAPRHRLGRPRMASCRMLGLPRRTTHTRAEYSIVRAEVRVRQTIATPARDGSSALSRGAARARRAIIRSVAGQVARLYFNVSYQLLTGSVAGRRLLALPAAGGGPVHGYFTSQDRDALLADLDPAAGDQLLDLGCGIGGIALELHRRSDARILGIDISSRAVAAATARARHAGVDASIWFLVGDISRPPRIRAGSAYANDSLMFVPDLVEALRGIGDALESDGRLFATLLMFGSDAEARLRRSIEAVGADVERLDDVTPALAERSLARASAAATTRRHGTTSLRGNLAMWLVGAEEELIRTLIAHSRVSRWRFTAHYRASRSGSTPERGPRHSRAAAAGTSSEQAR